MDIIDINDLNIGSAFSGNIKSKIYECKFEKSKYAFKRFRIPQYVFTSLFIEKITILNEHHLNLSIVPEYFVSKDHQVIGYLTELVSPNKISDTFSSRKAYYSLQRVKNSISELHSHDIIHGDIHHGNILLRDKVEVLSDFDNCSIIGSLLPGINLEVCSFPVRDFIMENGSIKNVHIFMHNIITFFELNDLYNGCYIDSLSKFFSDVKLKIMKKQYGIFESKDSQRICDDIVKLKAQEYLIDYINPTDVKRYRLNRLK